MLRRWIVFSFTALSCFAQLTPEQQKAVDRIAVEVLAETGVPSASVAVVKDKQVYAQAYGNARLEPKTPATAQMRYKIASNSKQLAASAVLLLAQERKISLDDTVSRFLPGLTRAKEVTIRQLLSHTSGYQDYYPLDYVAPFMRNDVTPAEILEKWAKIPLNFEPGTKWQYSNTNYVIVGQIVEKITGKPLIHFLRTRLFLPLGMETPIDLTRETLGAQDPIGYTQHALSPAREVAPEGNGWMYAAGELAMTPGDLAMWDRSLMEGTVLKPESIRALTTEVLLKGGSGTKYALGLEIGTTGQGKRRWSHSGGASGFVSRNTMFPDDGISITVLTNGEGRAQEAIAKKIEELLLGPAADPDGAPALERARRLFTGLQKGELDKSLIDSDLESYFTPDVVKDFADSLELMGTPESFTQGPHEERGGMMYRGYAVKSGTKSIRISTYVTKEGKFSQFLITKAVQ